MQKFFCLVSIFVLLLSSCSSNNKEKKDYNIVGSWKLLKIDLHNGPKMIGNFYDGIVISFLPDSTLIYDVLTYDTLCWELSYDSLSISKAKSNNSALQNGSYHIKDISYNRLVLQNDSSLDKLFFMKFEKEIKIEDSRDPLFDETEL
jgi:hypothetical protein